MNPADPTIDSSVDLITSNVTTKAISTDDANGSSVNANLEQRVFMVRVHQQDATLLVLLGLVTLVTLVT
jgi:hypothetical protein